MEETKLTFKRYEKKYLLSARQYAEMQERLSGRIEPDLYFKSAVGSVYYDDDSYSLIRHSLDKPVYKEKLRLRSYGVPGPEDPVFVELKKKFKGVVYKRRVELPVREAEAWLAGERPAPGDSQIVREIDFFLRSHALSPKAYIGCDRTAWVAVEDPEVRITFDENLRWRDTDLHLTAGRAGQPLLDTGQALLEIKLPEASPLWLARLLSELEIFPRSFSKYGACYQNDLLEKYFNGVISCV